LCIYDTVSIDALESWMLQLKADSSARKIQTKGSFELIKGMGRLLAPLL
jgi:hypothetical protein